MTSPIRGIHREALLTFSAWMLLAPFAQAQDLVPGAYLPVPVGFNAVTFVTSLSKGDITFDPALPVEEGHATIVGAGVAFLRTMNLAGHFANVGVVVPVLHGHVQGLLAGQFAEATRAGMGDPSVRVAVDLYGGRAQTRSEFVASQPSPSIVGAGFSVSLPLGEYKASQIVNVGTHRWAFKPELGLSRRRGHWTVEADISAVFFTDNTNYLNGGTRAQAPIAAAQGHLIYSIRPVFWVALDGNFWHGGRVTTNGVAATEQQHNSRFGVTMAVPIRRQRLRIAFSKGAYTRLGGDFNSLGVSYSYAWSTRK